MHLLFAWTIPREEQTVLLVSVVMGSTAPIRLASPLRFTGHVCHHNMPFGRLYSYHFVGHEPVSAVSQENLGM